MLDSNDKEISVLKENFTNTEYPFTELLSLLKLYKSSQNGDYELIYSPTALRAIDQHAANAMQSLLLGLQSLGYTLGIANETTSHIISHLGFFIQSISNLIEALHQLRADISQSTTGKLLQTTNNEQSEL